MTTNSETVLVAETGLGENAWENEHFAEEQEGLEEEQNSTPWP